MWKWCSLSRGTARLILGPPTYSSTQCVPRTALLHLMPKLGIRGALPLFFLYALMVWYLSTESQFFVTATYERVSCSKSLAAEPEGLTLLILEAAIGQVPKPFHQSPILTVCFPNVQINVILPSCFLSPKWPFSKINQLTLQRASV